MTTRHDLDNTRTIGICAHSYEGAALCFTTACREGAARLGAHLHPTIVLSAVPMGLSLPAWEADDLDGVGRYLREGVEQVARAGADFFICPDNTAHIVLERIADDLPIPGLHIAEVVCREIVAQGWKNVALLGTKWTMTGPVYARLLEANGLRKMIPDEAVRARINDAIFDELCLGIFRQETIDVFTGAIETLKAQGAECVILGCTEIPLIVTADNSALPTLDSTRLLARYAVSVALAADESVVVENGWIKPVSAFARAE
jgi:aspartate racemase